MMKQFLIVSSGKEKSMFNKSDIKYIVKKVIIILIVALIFYFIRNIPVKADSLNQTITLVQDNRYFSNSISGSDFVFSYDLEDSFLSNIGTDYQIKIDNYTTNNYSSYNKYILFYNSTLKQYVVSKYENIDTLNLIYDDESGYFTSSLGISYLLYKYDENLLRNGWNCNNSSTCFASGSSYNPYYINTLDNKKIGIIQNMNSSSSVGDRIGLNLDYEIVDTNISNLTINNDPYTDYYPTTIPSNYSEIDLQGYQGVVVVPKDYTQLSIESVNNVDFYQFPFYYVGCQNYGYFSLQNSQMIVSDLSNINVCSATPILVEALFPVYYNEYNSVSGVGTQQYQSNAIVIYNRNYDYSSFNPYSSTKVYIDLSLYNYELVSDFSSYTSSFTYIDKNGNEFTQTIDNIFSFEQLLQNGVNQDTINNNLDTKQKIDVILNYLKLPVNFLNSTIHATCQPLRAQFPHSDKYIELPCISNVVQDHLPEGFLSFIRMVVNGFVMYRVVMSTSIYLMNQMNPHDLGIEVIDL